MKFSLKAEKNVFINGKISTFKAGIIETTDKEAIAVLKKCTGVVEVKKQK